MASFSYFLSLVRCWKCSYLLNVHQPGVRTAAEVAFVYFIVALLGTVEAQNTVIFYKDCISRPCTLIVHKDKCICWYIPVCPSACLVFQNFNMSPGLLMGGTW